MTTGDGAMSEQDPAPVLVAVSADEMDAALSFAAEEAAREGCGLRLLHVVPLMVPGPEGPLLYQADLELMGRQVLEGAAERARDLVPDGTTVTTELLVGKPVTGVRNAAQAGVRMVVLQHRALSRLRRVVTRSVTSGVAARASVPVVGVPAEWTPGSAPGRVSVGVDVPETSHEVLRAALRAARTRGAGLDVVHTWYVPGAYEALLPEEEVRRWDARAEDEIRAVLDDLGGDARDVDVRVETRQATAADALLEAAARSSLLVLGRHDPLLPGGSHLGSVARAVLREASCPVLLVPPGRQHAR